MYQKIKEHPLYLFVFRIFVVFFLSAAVWILGTFFYYEYQTGQDIHNKMQIKQQALKETIKDIDFINKNKQYYALVNQIKRGMKQENILFVEIFDNHKQDLLQITEDALTSTKVLQRLKSLNNFSSNFYEIWPIDENSGYLYYQDKFELNNNVYYINLLVSLDSKAIDNLKNDISEKMYLLISTMIIVFLSIFPIIKSQYNKMIDKQNELIKSNINTLVSLGGAIAKRDSDTNEHNYRVTYYSIKLAEQLNLPIDQLKALIKGAFLHDIGKIAITDNILLKPGKLTTQEFEVMKTHVTSGIDIVANDEWLKDAQKVILNHHEKVDGSGYPNGLKAKEIPIEARIFAVADVFDALTSKRPYKKPFTLEKSISILNADAGTHFDREIVECFNKIYEEIFLAMNGKNSEELEKMFHEILHPYFYTN